MAEAQEETGASADQKVGAHLRLLQSAHGSVLGQDTEHRIGVSERMGECERFINAVHLPFKTTEIKKKLKNE